jgi:hypothetical protein
LVPKGCCARGGALLIRSCGSSFTPGPLALAKDDEKTSRTIWFRSRDTRLRSAKTSGRDAHLIGAIRPGSGHTRTHDHQHRNLSHDPTTIEHSKQLSQYFATFGHVTPRGDPLERWKSPGKLIPMPSNGPSYLSDSIWPSHVLMGIDTT